MSDSIDDLLADDDTDSGDDGAPEQDPSAPAKGSKSADKRVSDLQSARDKETARANKAEARLAALLAAAADRDTGQSDSPSGDDPLTEMARMFAVQQNPKLAEYGLTGDDLTGSTPREIAQSAAALIARFEKVETQVRNKFLAENGLAPELSGSNALPPDRDFSSMSSEDFEKLYTAAMQGQRL